MFKILLLQRKFFYYDSNWLVQIPHLYLDINTWRDVFLYDKNGIWLVQNIISNNCGEHIMLVFSISNQIPVKHWSIPVLLLSKDPLLMKIRIRNFEKNIKQLRKNKPGKIKVKHIWYWLAKGHKPKYGCKIRGKLQVTIIYEESIN